MDTEVELIARAGRGDRDAFEELVRAHLDRVAAVAHRFLGDPQEALDVAQEAFLAAWAVLPRWRPEARLFTWLYRTTLHLCTRRLRRPRLVHPAPAKVEAPRDDPDRRADLAQSLEQALARLSDRQREVFLRCHEQGETLVRIARDLGISEGAAKSHLHRALVSLRATLGQK